MPASPAYREYKMPKLSNAISLYIFVHREFVKGNSDKGILANVNRLSFAAANQQKNR